MANCQKCDKKKPWGEGWAKGKDVQEVANRMEIHDRKTIGSLESNEHICPDCVKPIWLKHAVAFTKFWNETATDEQKESAAKDEGMQKIFDKAKKEVEIEDKKERKTEVSTSPSASMASNPSSGTLPSGYTPPQTPPPTVAGYTTADQLQQIVDSQHDSYKQQWRKNRVIEFKNERIAILQRQSGSIVQFIVAFDQVTKEGYRLMAIDEGKTIQGGAGFSGGINAYYYFQKMEYVK